MAQRQGIHLKDTYENQPLPPSFSDVPTALKAIFDLLNRAYSQGQQTIFIEILTINLAAAPLYKSPKLVRGGTMMNLSTTDTITVGGGGEGAKGKPQNVVAGQGFVMNPAVVAGQGGGTFNFGNIDLSTLTAITNTNNTQILAVVYYN